MSSEIDSPLVAAGPAKGATRGRGRVKSTARLAFWRLCFGALLVGLWQLVIEFELIDSTVTSSPADVATFLWHELGKSELWSNLGATLHAVIIAFLLAAVVGIFVGISLALAPRIDQIVSPYLDALNAMPRIALAPVFVVAFGLTINAKIALAFSIAVFIVISAAQSGVRSVDIDIMRLSAVLGANRRQMFVKVLFPVSIPATFGGLRLAMIYSLLGVVTSELIAARDGMGQLLQQYASTFQLEAVYGLLIVLAVVATLLNVLMNRLERYLLRWQPPAN